MKKLFLTTALFYLLLAPTSARACSCGTGDPPVEFNRAKAVFIGVMLGGTEKLADHEHEGRTYKPEAGEVRFAVEEVFKGEASGEITVEVASMVGTSCGPYGLRRGERYVVYAYESEDEPKTLYTGVCTRTMEVDSSYAAADLKFLRDLPPAGSGGNLRGRVWADLRADGATPLADVTINIRGADEKVLTARTDQEGEFEVKNLKPGKYRVEPVLPANYTTEPRSSEVEVNDRGTAVVGFEAYIDGKVSGRVTDRDGRGFNSIFLKLDGEGRRVYGHSAGEGGRFEVEGVPPGEYILYLELQHDDHEKNRNFYYPGTFKREEAQAIRVGLGEKVEGLEFQLPDAYRIRTIEGRVTWGDGKPAAGVEVLLLCPRSSKAGGFSVESGPTGTRTDEEGRFRLEGFAGGVYWIEARGSKKVGEKGDAVDVHSPPKKIVVKESLKNLKLVLSEEGFSKGCEQ